MRASKHQLKRLGRKGLSLLMAMTMCLSLIQISVFADTDIQIQTTNQISNAWDGGAVYYTGTGAVGNSGNWAVRLSRMLTATGTENLFNVNMEVVTKNEEIEVTNSSAAVTLVLDTSGSMRFCSECGYDPGNNTLGNHYRPGTYTSCSNRTSRLATAKTALISFLNSYAKDEYGNFYSSARMVSLVTFASNSQKWDLSASNGTQYWVNVNNQTALNYVINNVINKSSGQNQITASGGTNTDAGMSSAADLLNTSTYSSAIGSIENRFCILLTDGKPTYYRYGGNGSDTTVWETYYAQQSCEDVTDTDAALYSIAYGLSGDTVPVYGVGNVSITNWLRDYCGSTGVYDANSSQALIDALNDILTDTSHSGSTTNGVSAAIGDLIGGTAPAYTFIGFNNADGSGLVLNGGTPATSYNGASVTGNALDWDLDDAEAVPSSSTTTYTLSYQVRLNNNIQSFLDWNEFSTDPAAEYSVGDATLSYTYTPASGTPSTPTVAFPVVKAHGYLGAFNFTKIAHHKNATGGDIPLAGAPFQLTNSANAPLYVQAGAITQNTTSQADVENQTLGEVAFTGIPSGYAYTLSETGEFTYNEQIYTPTNDTWNVSVSYGVVSGAPSGSVENMLKQISMDLTLTKTWNVPSADSTGTIIVDLQRASNSNPDTKTTVATLTLNGSSAESSSGTYQVAYVSEESNATKWVYTLTVPKINQETGGEYTYTTVEHSLGEGYTTTYSADTLSITNTITGKTSISVEKRWLQIDGEEMTSKPEVIVTLTANGNATANTFDMSDENGWSHTFTDLDTYDSYGQPIEYSVSEPDGDTYQQVGIVTGTGTLSDPFVLTNTVLEGTTSATVTKTWQGGSNWPGVTVELLRDGQSFGLTDGQTSTTYDMTSADQDASVAAGNVWTHTFTGLPEFAFTRGANNVITGVHKYTYSVKELSDWDGYTSVKGGDLNLINTRTQKVSIEVNKEWDHKDFNLEDQEVTFELRQDGTLLSTQSTQDLTTTFSDLDQFDPATGNAYAYTVQEVGPTALLSSYTTEYDYGNGNNVGPVVFGDNHVGVVNVTNTLNADDETVVITVNKNWQHPQGTTPPSVKFTLTQTGATTKDVDSVTLEADDGTTHNFDPQPKYYYEQEEEENGTDESGAPVFETVVTRHEYTYTVTEDAVDGYTSDGGVQDGDIWTFTNTITGDVTLTAEKVWQDLSATGRPTATIQLVRSDGTLDQGSLVWADVVGKTLVTSGTVNSASWTVDKYSPTGKLYTYKVVENGVSNYTTTYSPSNATYTADINKVTVTNTLTQDATYSLTASKTWVDNGNADGTRKPITLTLYQVVNSAETALGTVIINADGTLVTGTGAGTYTGGVSVDNENLNLWSIQFNDLDKYAYVDGSVYAYSYKVTEAAVDGYDTAIANDKDITNTLRQSTTSITIHKNWVDPADTEHPDVTFTLNAMAGGGNVAGFPKTVTLGFSVGATTPSADNLGADTASLTGDDWYYTWDNLPKYDDAQRRITYTVSEVSVPGYTSVKNGFYSFTNTIDQKLLDFEGQKVWDMGNQDEDEDYLKPGPQPVTIGLYSVDASGNLGQRVIMDGLTNPVTVTPSNSTFKFANLPRYNLGSGEEYHYTVREVQVTTGGETGEPGYTPIPGGGKLTLTVSDHGNDFNYKYTVSYAETPKTPADDQNGGTDTTVTNTYEDPEVYFYQIIGNYYTYNTSANTQIYKNEGVNLTDGGSYVAIPRDELINPTITADPSEYTRLGGVDFVFNGTDEDVSVTLDTVNHMYIITLNYVRHLYKLDVKYVFPDNEKPADFDDYTAPSWQAPGEGEIYTDPGSYLGNATYTGTYKAAPAGYEITKVTVKDSESAASDVSKDYNGGSFDHHDVTVTYYYEKVVNPTPDETDASFTIHKNDLERKNEQDRLITGSAATFQLFTDEDCTEDAGKALITTQNGVVAVSAKALGEGTFFMKEVQAPTGYTAGNTVWQIDVSKETEEEVRSGQFVNVITWGIDVKVANEEDSALEEGILNVDNTRQYGYLTITKTVTGLEQTKTFDFTVSGNNHGSIYEATHSITVTGNNTVSLADAIKVPIGTYVVTEDSNSANIGGGYSVTTTYSGENGANTVEVTTNHTVQAPANITVTNTYSYTPSNVTINGQKVWDDDNNRDGLRPASIRVQLYQGETAIPGATTNVPAGTDAFSIAYDSNQYPGAITVKEIGYTDSTGYHEGMAPGYESQSSYNSESNKYIVTNTHEPETVYIQADKVWASGTPQAVTLRLLANGQPLDSVLVLDGTEDQNEYAPWAGEFPGTFSKYEGGKLINYTVTEDSLGGNWSYTTSQEPIVDGDTIYGYHFTVTNSYSSGGGGSDTSYYYRIDYVYTGYGADGSTIYSDAVTGGVQTTGSSAYSFTAADSANHGGYAFSLTSDANLSASLAGTSRSNPYVFTVYYEFTELEDGGTPTGETPDTGTGTTPDQPIDIPDVAVPKAEVPATGDTLALWIMAAAVSGVGLVWLALIDKKRREDENS